LGERKKAKVHPKSKQTLATTGLMGERKKELCSHRRGGQKKKELRKKELFPVKQRACRRKGGRTCWRRRPGSYKPPLQRFKTFSLYGEGSGKKNHKNEISWGGRKGPILKNLGERHEHS